MRDTTHDAPRFASVPLFPLPNVVLFPRAVLPLHIFEDRYRAMTADILRGDRQLAMALLKDGWEQNYHGRPEIEPVVCVGTILTHEQLEDGTYNFLLQGHTRARIVREQKGVDYAERPYRVAELESIEIVSHPEPDLAELRHRIMAVFDQGSLLATVIGRQFRQLLASPLSTAEVADLIAFNFLDDLPLKQSLLSEANVLSRVERIVAAFEAARPALQPVMSAPAKPSLN